MDRELVNWADARIHVLSQTLHYGFGAFEGIRAYPTEHGIAVFRLHDHIDRLFASAKILMIDIPYTANELVDACADLVRVNRMTTGAYIRPLVHLGWGEMGLDQLSCPVNVVIVAWILGAYFGESAHERGISVKVSSWRRHDPNAMPTAAKAVGNYVNSQLARVEALRGGYDEAVLLASDGRVSECSTENVFVVRDGALITPPTSAGGTLAGITQDTVEVLARDLGTHVQREDLVRTDLYLADEMFITGTSAEITPVRAVDDRTVGSGKPGPVTIKLQQAFAAAVRGKDDRHKDWLYLVS